VSLIAVRHRRPTATPDAVLVQEAAAGSGISYATLYDRHETPVYNYCLRLLGSPDDAADATQEAFLGVLRRLRTDDAPVLDFGSYLFTAARNESYALMRRRSRASPTDDVLEDRDRPMGVESDPERAALLQDVQADVRAANGRLAPRYREVLALREVADRSYEEIGAILGISANAAAQLLWRARTKLRDELRMGALASVAPTSEECERAQLLIAVREDGEPLPEVDEDWLDEHLEECGSCRASRAMLLEVGASYRCWAPVAAVAALRPEVLTRGGEIVGVDWSGIAAAAPKGGAASTSHGGAAAAGGVAVAAAVGLALAGILRSDAPPEKDAARALPAPESPALTTKPPAREPRVESRTASVASRRSPRPDGPPAGRPATEPSKRQAAEVRGKEQAPPDEAQPRPRQPAPRDDGSPPPKKAPPPAADSPPPESPPASPAPRGDPPPTIAPRPPIDLPPPIEPSACRHPGGGLAGCPPGHGGVPPGHGGVPPGLGVPPPGHTH
jgi:RNA polymerase sigma factor (sigma-70 family)